MSEPRIVAYLAEPRPEKTVFFQAVGAACGGAKRLPTWPVSARSFPETAARAEAALARAKKQPKGPLGRWLKLAFLKGRYNWARRYFEAHPNEIALCWQGLTGTRRAFMEGARDAGAMRLFAELAPFPARRTLDFSGVNAESSVPQAPEFYDGVTPDQAVLEEIRNGFFARNSKRSDVQQSAVRIAEGKFLFVPLQVPDDSQMILFAGWCGGLSGFVDALAAASAHLPEGWHLRLKEHPSAKQPVGAQIKAHIAAGARLVLDNESDSFEQIRASQGVVTVNSSMGLQAMFYDKPVVHTGATFWGLRGMSHHADSAENLAQAMAQAAELGYDAQLRARFLTWLAQSYYVGFDGGDLTWPEQVSTLVAIAGSERHA